MALRYGEFYDNFKMLLEQTNSSRNLVDIVTIKRGSDLNVKKMGNCTSPYLIFYICIYQVNE
jgi:hypothetical protein